MTRITNTTLRCAPGDPRFLLEKDGWDGSPREWTPADVLFRPMWAILFNDEAYFDRKDDVVGWLTNFDGEGPVATVRFRSTDVKGGYNGTVTVSAKSIEETFALAEAAYYDLRDSVPYEKRDEDYYNGKCDRQREFFSPSDTFDPNDCPF